MPPLATALSRHTPGSGRNQAPDDDVFLETAQVIDRAAHCSVGKHPGRLLERSRRDERLGRQRGLGDPQQYRPENRGLLVCPVKPFKLFKRPGQLNFLAPEESAVGRRSEERRVGKESRSWFVEGHLKKRRRYD